MTWDEYGNINRQQSEFLDYLLKNKELKGEHIASIFNAVKTSEDPYNLTHTFENGNMSDRILRAKTLLSLKGKNGGLLLHPSTISYIIKDKDFDIQEITKLEDLMGDKIHELKNDEIKFAAKLSALYGINSIQDIPLSNKKDLIQSLVECSNGTFEISDNFKKLFPLVPNNVEEYCSLLSDLSKSLFGSAKPMNNDKIETFNSSCSDLSKSLSKLSDDEFNTLSISQDYSRDNFIDDIKEITKDLSKEDTKTVFEFFNFELRNVQSYKNNDYQDITAIIGYPNSIDDNNEFEEKLKNVKDENVKETIRNVREKIQKFNTCHITSSNKNIEEELNSIMSIMPELRTMIGKVQHGTHSFDILKHSLKVLQKVSQNENFEKLNESDKKIMLVASLMHDITKLEGNIDKTHPKQGAFDTYFLSKKLNLTKDEELKLYTLVKRHDWLEYTNSYDVEYDQNAKDLRLKTIAFEMQYDNLFDMAKIFTEADLKSVKGNDKFYDKYKDALLRDGSKIDELVSTLKTTQPLLPVTKIPKASEIIKNGDIKVVDEKTGKTNVKGIYINKEGLVVIKYNEVENETWEKIGFPKGSISQGIKTLDAKGKEIDTGNIKFFAHGLDYPNQLAKFDGFAIPDSDALLSVSYAERPESKYRFFRTQGVLLDADSKYVCGGGETDSGSGCGKNLQEFVENYAFKDSTRYQDRVYISNLIKKTLNLSNEQYIEFWNKNKNKDFTQIEPKEYQEKLIKAFALINSNTRTGDREYNEMYATNPNVMATYVYPYDDSEKMGDNVFEVIDKKPEKDWQVDRNFLKEYSIKRDIPMVVFGD